MLDNGQGRQAIGPLRQLLEETATAEGLPMKALTVLARRMTRSVWTPRPAIGTGLGSP